MPFLPRRRTVPVSLPFDWTYRFFGNGDTKMVLRPPFAINRDMLSSEQLIGDLDGKLPALSIEHFGIELCMRVDAMPPFNPRSAQVPLGACDEVRQALGFAIIEARREKFTIRSQHSRHRVFHCHLPRFTTPVRFALAAGNKPILFHVMEHFGKATRGDQDRLIKVSRDKFIG